MVLNVARRDGDIGPVGKGGRDVKQTRRIKIDAGSPGFQPHPDPHLRPFLLICFVFLAW